MMAHMVEYATSTVNPNMVSYSTSILANSLCTFITIQYMYSVHVYMYQYIVHCACMCIVADCVYCMHSYFCDVSMVYSAYAHCTCSTIRSTVLVRPLLRTTCMIREHFFLPLLHMYMYNINVHTNIENTCTCIL